jgi:hypothetical protein
MANRPAVIILGCHLLVIQQPKFTRAQLEAWYPVEKNPHMSPINVPPDTKGAIILSCYAMLAGRYFECLVIDADAEKQTAEVQRPGSLFSILVPFRDIQNVTLKYSNGEIIENFGAPRSKNPASLAFIQYASVS